MAIEWEQQHWMKERKVGPFFLLVWCKRADGMFEAEVLYGERASVARSGPYNKEESAIEWCNSWAKNIALDMLKDLGE